MNVTKKSILRPHPVDERVIVAGYNELLNNKLLIFLRL